MLTFRTMRSAISAILSEDFEDDADALLCNRNLFVDLGSPGDFVLCIISG